MTTSPKPEGATLTPGTPIVQTLPGFKEFLIGDSGTGKTHVIRTFLKTGVQPLVLATENGFRSLAPCDNPACEICKDNRDIRDIPYVYIPPTGGSIDTLIEQAKNVATMTQQQLTQIRDTKRLDDYSQMVKVFESLKSFKASDGVDYGPVTSWSTDRVLVVDGLSSLGTMAMDIYAGRRPLYDKPDYQIAQKMVMNLVVFLTHQLKTHVVLIGHTGRGQDALESHNKITVNTVGQKLAPDLPRLFDDMVHAERDGKNFKWSTATAGAIAKGRNLPISDNIKPTFRPVLESWKKAGGVVEPTKG